MKKLTVKSFATTILSLAALVVLGSTAQAAGPTFDSSGNSSLNGTYYFRQVFYLNFSATGALSRAIALNGSFNFDGAGHYSIPVGATVLDSSVGQQQQFSTAITGTYTLSSTGYGSMTNPLSAADTLYFTVSSGVLTASTTEGGFNDLLIAAQLSSPQPSAATLAGSWSMAGFFPGGSPTGTADVFFQMNPDGAGNVGSLSVSGYIGGKGTTLQTQTIGSAKYTFSTGAAVVNFPTSSSALYFSGPEYLNFSPDGNFIFGGSPNGYDMLVGVRNAASGATQNFSGLYYQAGVDQDLSLYGTTGFANFFTYYGSLNAGGGSIISHERLQSVFNSGALGSTFADSYPTTLTSPYNDTTAFVQYAYGTNGKYRIGAGTWPYLGLNVAVQAPSLSGPGVFLNPAGIVNAASSAPFTAGISPGELITLYGNNLATSTVVAPVVPLPTQLGGVTVSIDGLQTPIYYVSPGQIAVLVPYGLPTIWTVAQIQVTNSLGTSNTVTAYVYKTTPGLFTVPPGGLGYGALVHANGTLITKANPALPGETIEAFLTGLGSVFPSVQDGAAGPAGPLSYTLNTITTAVGGITANTVYTGLAPTLAALYQVNLTVPATAPAGDNTLDIGGPDAYAAQALIPIGTAPAGSVRKPEAATQTLRTPRVINSQRIIDEGPSVKQSAPYLDVSRLVKQ